MAPDRPLAITPAPARGATPRRAAACAFLLCAPLLIAPTRGDPPRAGAGDEAIRYAIVVTGGDLLQGAYADSHTHFLTRTLRPLGMQCVGSITVDDRRADIEAALRHASAMAPLIVVTGGLGPTDNDITRETLSAFTGIPLVADAGLIEALRRRFAQGNDPLRANLARQAHVPARGTHLPNSSGTAVGLVFDGGSRVVIALPGPPRELEPMVREHLIPYLQRRFDVHPPGCTLTVRFVGLGQSAIDQALDEHVPLPDDIILTSQFDGSRVDFTFALPHDTAADRARLETLRRRIDSCLHESIYAFDNASLEAVVLRLLRTGNATVALAEVATGGALALGLGAENEGAAAIAGAFVAPSEERLRRLLRVPDAAWRACASSDDRARLLAGETARVAGADWGVAMGEFGPDGSGAHGAVLALRFPDGHIENWAVTTRPGAPPARSMLVTQGLDRVRRRLVNGVR